VLAANVYEFIRPELHRERCSDSRAAISARISVLAKCRRTNDVNLYCVVSRINLAHGVPFFARLALIAAEASSLHVWHFASFNRALVLRLPHLTHLPSARRFARVACISSDFGLAVIRMR
jgi:hypothetical protein